MQKLFKFDDGERVVGALSLDARLPVPEKLIAVSKRGFGLRFALDAHTGGLDPGRPPVRAASAG